MLSACSVSGGDGSGTGEGEGDRQTIRLVMKDRPSSLDPCDVHMAANGPVLRGNITEALTKLDIETSEVEESLAESWEETSPTTWQFKLREGVTFHNGEPFNADAVAHWVERIVDPEAGCYVLGSVVDENIVSATAVDEYTVEISTQNPDPILPLRMSFVDIGAPSDDPLTKAQEPIGTGPYKFDSFSPGGNLEISRYEDYWGEEPQIDAATYMFRDESSVRAAMATAGEVDIAASIGAQDADMEGARTYTVAETLYYRFGVTHPPLDDIRVRQAINYAVDRQRLIDNVYGGNGEPASDIFLPSVVGYDDSVKWEYDPERARELLAEAEADGVAIDTEFDVIGELGIRGSNGSEVSDTVAAMLQEVGLNARSVTVPDTAEPLAVPEEPGQKPALIQNVHGNSFGDAHISLSGKLGCDAPQSPLCDETFDEMLAEAGAAGGDEREALLQEAARYTYENHVAHLPLLHMADTVVVANDSIRYEPNSATSERLMLSEISFE